MIREHEEREHKIERLTQERVLQFMEADPSRTDTETFNGIMNQAKIGMIFLRDREMTKRIQQGQVIRVINLVSGDKAEIMDYIQSSLPEINIIKKIENK